jgi:enoyl-[acyl-carrier protein] reductase III
MVAIRCSEIPDIRASEVPDIPGSKALAGKSIDANPLEISRVPIMTEPLAGKVAVVTGASRGIGRSIAHRLATAGCDIVANYYNSHEEAEKLCDEVRALGRRAFAIKASVGIPESVDELLEELRKHFDRIDIIVSNAASGVLKPAMKMTLKHWRWCMETNALALNLVTQRSVEMMPAGGSIVALSSLGASRAMPGYGFVGASKAALESLVRTLAQELGPRGIRVNTVSAGVVDTDALKYFPNHDQVLENFAERTPLGPTLTPDDVAGAVYLLCLPEARMITGHTLVVDGGFCISG